MLQLKKAISARNLLFPLLSLISVPTHAVLIMQTQCWIDKATGWVFQFYFPLCSIHLQSLQLQQKWGEFECSLLLGPFFWLSSYIAFCVNPNWKQIKQAITKSITKGAESQAVFLFGSSLFFTVPCDLTCDCCLFIFPTQWEIKLNRLYTTWNCCWMLLTYKIENTTLTSVQLRII